ncbi:MAG: hypothetical protein J0L75_21235 [Spirochaetes bacterium]|nr:hypothetical protein [Spirochaetota bacterium]
MPKGGAAMHLCTKCVLDLNHQLGLGDRLKPAAPGDSAGATLGDSWIDEALTQKG